MTSRKFVMYWSFPEWPTACEIWSAFQYGQMPHWRSKCSNSRAAIEWFYWNVWNILTSVLWPIRVQTMEMNSSMCYSNIDSFWSSITLNFLGKSHARENLRKHGTVSSFPSSVLHQSAHQNHSVTVKKFFRAILILYYGSKTEKAGYTVCSWTPLSHSKFVAMHLFIF